MSELTIPDLYAEGLERVLALGRSLTEADGDVPTAACPGWTVRDVFAHLAGAPADILAGRVEGAPGDEWTGRQVDERRDRTLTENVDELAELGPKLVEALATFPIPQMPIDQWIHEQDVRGALGKPGSRDVPVVGWALAAVTKGVGQKRTEGGEPALRVEGDSGTWTLGEGEPVATVKASDFDLLRAFLGRRSPAQVRAWVVDGDPGPVLGTYAVFGPCGEALVE